MRILALALLVIWPGSVLADSHQKTVQAVISEHILPGFEHLADATEQLKTAAIADCTAESRALRTAFHNVFDAWLGVSHLRFGPTEVDDRAFALAFWPDTKGFTPKTLSELIRSEDPIVHDKAQFGSVSIAARGIYGLEFLLYDAQIGALGSDAYRCALVQGIAADIDANADAILSGWKDGYADALLHPGANSPYRSQQEAVQELYKALTTGLQVTSDTRLGRPLGTFDRPRPNRAEAWRSARSLGNVEHALVALRDLALTLSREDAKIAGDFQAAFDHSLGLAADLNDPVFALVSDPQGRFRVEVLQQSIDRIREIAAAELGPLLGVAAGFNALDGD